MMKQSVDHGLLTVAIPEESDRMQLVIAKHHVALPKKDGQSVDIEQLLTRENDVEHPHEDCAE